MELGLTAYEIAVVFPFHLGFDSDLKVVQLGPSLRKLVPELAVGQHVLDHFVIEPLEHSTFSALRDSPSRLVVLRGLRREVMLRGQTIWYPKEAALLYLCSPWFTSTAELHRRGLSLADFAVHDPMADLLQVLQSQESTLQDVRKLVAKLSQQRRDQRAAAARMERLHEITRILGGGLSIDDVAQQVIEQTVGILHFPVTGLWLEDSASQFACIAPGAGAAAAHELAQRLLSEPPDFALDIWIPTEVPLVRRYAATEIGGRTCDAAALGFPVIYQFQIEGAGGVLGAIEAYGVQVPAHEHEVLEAMAEVASRLGQFLDKARADAALRSSIKVAAAATVAKSQFLARMSHEIRTPINGVLGMIELVLSSALTETQRSQLELARSSGELLLGLVNDVLDFSKIEAGRLEISKDTFDLQACVRRAFAMFEARAAAKRLTYTLALGADVPQLVVGDELRLSQVLVNLISNAIKFTKTGAVTVAVRPRQSGGAEAQVDFEVRDTGIGVAPARRSAIFAAFTQAEIATAREFGGTGLGLTICKQLVGLMGGELALQSELGKGSAFTFSLRLERAEAVAQEDEHGQADARPLHVLVVEDNEINQAVVRGLLERDGHSVEIADRMDRAISRGCDGEFDLVLMDVQLPDGDGLTATAAIRAHQRRTGGTVVPIIGLSAQAVAGDRERALGAGMNEYLTKPVRPAALSEVMRKYGARAGARRRRTTASLQTRARAEVELQSRTGPLPVLDGQVRTGPLPVLEPRGGAGVGEGQGWAASDEEGFLGKAREYADLGDMLFSMARSLASDAPTRLAEVEERMAAGDLGRVSFLAHGLAGASGTIGFVGLEQAARAAERLARSGELGSLRDEVCALRRGVESLLSFVASQRFVELQASMSDR